MFRGPLVILLSIVAGSASAQWLDRAFLPHYADREYDRSHNTERSANRTVTPHQALDRWIFPNINLTNSPNFDQNEPSIAVDPIRPAHLIVGANDDRDFRALWEYRSTDFGASWSDMMLPVDVNYGNATDPSVAYSSDGSAYFGYGREGEQGFPYPPNDVVAFRSVDDGATWDGPSRAWGDSLFNVADTLADKYYLTTDRGERSPRRGAIYMTWVEQVAFDTSTRIVITRSTDQGAHWSPKTYLTTGGRFYNAPFPSVGADGTVEVAFADMTTGSTAIYVARSLDGLQYDAPVKVADYRNLGPVLPPNDPRGYVIVKGNLAVNSFPSIVQDQRIPSRSFVAWTALGSDARSHVYVSTSDDSGMHWSTPGAIDGDSAAISHDKFFAAVNIDPRRGDVGVVYNDSRLDPLDTLTDIFMSFSTDGGSHWATRRISSASFDPRHGHDTRGDGFNFFGDYISVAADSGNWYPAWTDSRSDNDCEIYTAIVRPRAPLPVLDLRIADTTIAGTRGANLTWQYPSALTTFGYALGNYTFQIKRRDQQSESSVDSGGRSFFDPTANPAGNYEYFVYVKAVENSLPDSVEFGTATVAASVTEDLSVRLVQVGQSMYRLYLLGRPLQRGNSVLRIYDELGRMLAVREIPALAAQEIPNLAVQDVQLDLPQGQMLFYTLTNAHASRGYRTATGKLFVGAR